MVCGVLSNPPSAKGRHKTPLPTPVAALAAERGLPVLTPEHLDAECRAAVSTLQPDILVCFAYGHIFGPKFLSLFKYGGINLHPSALPQYRGCTPVNAAILNGDAETAFSVQTLSLKMDEGDILAQVRVPLDGTETAGSLLNDAAVRGADLICALLAETAKNAALPAGTPQSGAASYTGIITKDDARIKWALSGKEIDCAVRAYSPEPCAWTEENGAPLKILAGIPVSEEKAGVLGITDFSAVPGTVCAYIKSAGILVRCKDGFFAVTELQRQGKKPMDYKSFMNGVHNFEGTLLN